MPSTSRRAQATHGSARHRHGPRRACFETSRAAAAEPQGLSGADRRVRAPLLRCLEARCGLAGLVRHAASSSGAVVAYELNRRASCRSARRASCRSPPWPKATSCASTRPAPQCELHGRLGACDGLVTGQVLIERPDCHRLDTAMMAFGKAHCSKKLGAAGFIEGRGRSSTCRELGGSASCAEGGLAPVHTLVSFGSRALSASLRSRAKVCLPPEAVVPRGRPVRRPCTGSQPGAGAHSGTHRAVA